MWGFGESTGSYLDQFPLQLGVAPVGLAIVAAVLALRRATLRGRRPGNRATEGNHPGCLYGSSCLSWRGNRVGVTHI